MRVLFVTGRRYPPDRHGGAQNSAHELLRRLIPRENAVEVAAARAPGAGLLMYRMAHLASGRRWLGRADLHNGYPTWRVADWQLGRLVSARMAAFAPDVLLTDQPELVDRIAAPVPTVLRVADVSFAARSTDVVLRRHVRVFANSRFIARRLRETCGLEAPVLYPIVDPARYRTARRSPDHVTFFNPIAGKGLDVVLATAHLLPHRRFILISGWPRPTAETAQLKQRVDRLPNVELRPWCADPRSVYASTRVLFFPAQWEEGFGRVVLEAQASGIPVVASDRGGLPEAVGAGGRILAHDAPANVWAAAIETLMSNDDIYRARSEAALANLRRRELDPEHITDAFVQLLERAIAGARVSPPATHPADSLVSRGAQAAVTHTAPRR